jgi:hypothetical protein
MAFGLGRAAMLRGHQPLDRVARFILGSASASTLTVHLVADVTAVNDSSGILGGQVTVGQVASGQYDAR